MKVPMKTSPILADARQKLRNALSRVSPRTPDRDAEPALRAELLNAEQMESHGIELASSHKLRGRPGRDRLLPRLEANSRVLAECRETFSAAPSADARSRQLSPAGEWLLDNYWLIEEQIALTRRHLPKGYSKELPQLAEGPSAGYPRVYDLALENISHGDGRLDSTSLQRFAASYQFISPLSLGELWAIPIMLRLALIENLRRVSCRVLADWRDRQTAVQWADRFIEVAGKDRKRIVLTVAEMAVSSPPMSSAFVAELTRRLQGQGAALSLPMGWIEDFLAEKGVTIDQLVKGDTRQQAADQVSVSNSITSLRMLAAVNWREFVESLSVVERALRRDPAGVYPRMDFATRDHYRHRVEALAKKYGLGEKDVSLKAVELAAAGNPEPPLDEAPEFLAERTRHVGWFLAGDGLPALKTALAAAGGKKARPRWRGLAARRENASLPGYLCPALLLACLVAWPFAEAMGAAGANLALQALAAAAALLVGSEIALRTVNWLVTLLVPARPMARMDYGGGLPDEARTLVVIPALAGSVREAAALLEKLEVHYLANRDRNIQFGLLTDFKDSDRETEPGDAAVLEALTQGIDALNGRYPQDGPDAFFLCHRPRRWNEGEGAWMGFERKRGKLAECNALLRGTGRDRFLRIRGNTLDGGPDGPVPPVRYVVTLDTDTRLPRDAARQLAGCMAHPLNRPVYDPDKKRVIAGYGIIQPRLAITLPSANRTPYSRLFCFNAGVDPYTLNVSDVYQDLFGQGSFTGKGIYDVAAFGEALRDRFPDNAILSHDLIEGGFARSGLASDILLYEEFPSCYGADVKRRHRWIRGDWQLLPWLMPRVRTRSGAYGKNPLSRLTRWKLLDNLRRSLVPAALLALLCCGWLALPRPALWTAGVLAALFALPVVRSLVSLARKPRDFSFRLHLGAEGRALGRECLEILLLLAWLPFEAAFSLDAALRTLWRMGVSGKHLLQWSPSVDAERSCAKTPAGVFRLMAVCPLAALAAAALLLPGPSRLLAASPLLALWLASPGLAWFTGMPRKPRRFVPDKAQTRFLRALARRTWAFFQTYCDKDNNWLPPDNFQELPSPVVARRTSPTNIGIALLAHLAARQFGYTGNRLLLERLAAIFATLSRLERHQGHFCNWYDTRTLEPLTPRYISTVDSGNMAAHLMVLRQGLLALGDEPVFSARHIRGIADTALIVEETLPAARNVPAWQAFALALKNARDKDCATLEDARGITASLASLAQDARAALAPLVDQEAAFWLEALAAQCRDILEELEAFALPAPVNGRFPGIPTLNQLARLDASLFAGEAREKAEAARAEAARLAALAGELAGTAGEMARMDFTFLYDRRRDLLSIGYNLDDGRLDAGYYDLLASEARLTYFLAIAQGQLPQESWFALGRLLTGPPGAPVLLSWSGSMFEYLMPLLVMPSYEGTLLDETCRGAVRMQIRYGRELDLPWGVSESGYNMRDGQYNYQYRAFGVPGLGLDRGLGDSVVLAPYASALALMVSPEAACKNLRKLAGLGASGRYGMYEALDYTAARLPRGKEYAVIRSFMAHHQGMSFLSLADFLLDRPMRRLFLAEPSFQATRLLLEERMPEAGPERIRAGDIPPHSTGAEARAEEKTLRVITSPDTVPPAAQLLSNGRYHVMVSSGGGGYSRYNGLALTRWREDSTRDNWGSFCYLRDVATGHVWSATHQPVCRRAESYEAVFSDARAEFKVREKGYDIHTEIAVSPEDDIELRRVRITNRSRERRTIELTSYAEIVLAPQMADEQHPAFSNLFVETDIEDQLQAILSTRRPRSGNEPRLYHFHLLAAHGADLDCVSYETSRARFIGRCRTLASPAALDPAPGRGLLSGTQGAVLDPIASIRCRVTLSGGQAATIDLVSGVAKTRDDCLALIDKFRDKRLADRVFDLAWTHSQVLLHQFNATLFDAHLFEQMASSVIYPNRSLRADPDCITANTRGQAALWGQGLSGDLPVVLVKVTDSANIGLVTQMVKAHAYWRMKGLETDLVIWNEDHFSYRQNLHDLICSIIPAGLEGNVMDRPGGIFVRAAQQLTREDRVLIQTVARLVISDTAGTLREQVFRRRAAARLPGVCPRTGNRPKPLHNEPESGGGREPLILENQYGGFTPDGSEYVITCDPGETTPAPWANVLANAGFGTIVSESGSAYTWKENAHEFRLTPWHNDPVSDTGGEALYIRDEETGACWSPTLLPRRGPGTYTARHGFGYSVFTSRNRGVRTTLEVFVARDDPVKISRLRLENASGRSLRLSVTGYAEWVLADLRSRSSMHVVTENDGAAGAILAQNAYTMDFPGRVAFFGCGAENRTITCDRTEFLGRNGDMARPAAMGRACLSGRTGAGLDPCGAIQTVIELKPGDSREIVFVLGAAMSRAEACALASRHADRQHAEDELRKVRERWRDILGAVRVRTPDEAVNVMVNGWLLYQCAASRFLGRSGYYQSGGAFGFRDQLQDCMALVHADPGLVREHLLVSAAHQFPEGDVQHWWHPPLDRGVRTRCSDDYLWLPLAVARYVDVTGDVAVLDEEAGYIEMRPLNPEEESFYDLPMRSALRESLYLHCVRAVRHGLRFGVHGLPLMGGGDWNDGMDRVGIEGRGESVWLGFFLHRVLAVFEPLALARGDAAFAAECRKQAETLRASLNANGWDGQWFRRAYFDDGRPLGSRESQECRIDSIAQSWSVLSGAAPEERRKLAMDSLYANLVRRDIGIVQLLDPPFDHSDLDPGYIKGYVPGVRENGGQYTHAAVWAAMAFAKMGDAARAWELASMINPVRHGDSPEAVERYMVEPYVVAADVYGVAPHEGRGGWTWYTGSAGWMYRLFLESLLGLRARNGAISLDPLLPQGWDEVSLVFKERGTAHAIGIRRDGGQSAPAVTLDGKPLERGSEG